MIKDSPAVLEGLQFNRGKGRAILVGRTCPNNGGKSVVTSNTRRLTRRRGKKGGIPTGRILSDYLGRGGRQLFGT